MAKHEMKIERGYNAKTQAKVGLFAAQLDDQLKWLKKSVKDLTVEQLEWQLRPGMNTVGMLLAHLALVEVWWINVAAPELPWEPDGKKLMNKVCGFEDDGIPLPADGRHVDFLRGFASEKYLAALAKARRSAHRELKTWRDRDLDKLYKLRKHQFSRAWTLYHVLEHFASHFGQILMLKHMMRDAGVLAAEKEA
jgi:uncharacterized damage-inducible protein DinB